MSTNLEDPLEETAATLVSGIHGDLQNLVEQQFQLTRREIEEELRKSATVAALISFGNAMPRLG